ncbi:MAG: SPASM domain-containing protein [Gemmiger sp.]|nr:SPASM domain-containing protein [Gemmiger sp.]
MKQNLTVLVKPASGRCNLACRYCFYKDVAAHRAQFDRGLMAEGTAAALIEKTLAYAAGGQVSYCFQGGEPTLAGLDFYRFFIRTVESKNQSGSEVSYALQTNGILLDDAWCAFLKEQNFLVGLSLDGRAAQHDHWRVDAAGNGTFARVKAALLRLQQQGVPVNLLAVATPQVAAHIDDIWAFFVGLGCKNLQFTTSLEPVGQRPFTAPWALDNEQYYRFQKRLLDLYLAAWRAGQYVSVRHLDNLMRLAQGQPPEMCGLQGRCAGQLVVEADGTVYPCDFYCEDAYALGNILSTGVAALCESPALRRFTESSTKVEPRCRRCPAYPLCRGGCRRERDYAGDATLRPNLYCDARRRFYRYFVAQLQNPQP